MVLPDGEFTMINVPKMGKNSWLMVKHTRSIKDPVKTKPKYKDYGSGDPDPNNPNTVWQPKVDGGHTIFRLNSDGLNRIYSYRSRKDTGDPIDHTHQVPGLRDELIPTELNGVEVRGELYAKKKDGRPMEAQEVTGILNSKPMKSRETQGLKGSLLPYLFSVKTWKNGKNVENATYAEQLKMLEEVQKKVPAFTVAETAKTPEEKREMYNLIQQKQHPDTEEGMIEWDLTAEGGNPKKKKLRDNHEVIIRNIYPAITPKTGRVMAGGFEYSWEPESPIVGRVGTGFTEELRKEMIKDPQKFINRIARIKTQQVFKSGAARAPSFYQMHVEKNL